MKTVTFFLVGMLCLFAGAAPAEVLKIGSRVEVLKPVDAPTRGMTKTRVAKRFGEPLKKNPAVGQPPISSWEYPGYTVYFEGQYVIHSVANGQRRK